MYTKQDLCIHIIHVYTQAWVVCIHSTGSVYTHICVYTGSVYTQNCVYTKLYQTRPDQTRPVLSICVDHDLPHDHGVWYDPGGTTPRSKQPDP